MRPSHLSPASGPSLPRLAVFILAGALLGLLAAVAWIAVRPPTYRAMGKLIVAQPYDASSDRTPSGDSRFYATQQETLQGAFLQATVSGKLSRFRSPTGHLPDVRLTVDLPRYSQIFRITVDSSHAEFAREYVDTLMAEYRALRLRMLATAGQAGQPSLDTRLQECQSALTVATNALAQLAPIPDETAVTARRQALAALEPEIVALDLRASHPDVTASVGMIDVDRRQLEVLHARRGDLQRQLSDFNLLKKQRATVETQIKELTRLLNHLQQEQDRQPASPIIEVHETAWVRPEPLSRPRLTVLALGAVLGAGAGLVAGRLFPSLRREYLPVVPER